MIRAARLLPLPCAVLALSAGSAANAQDTGNRNPQITPEFLSDFNSAFYRGVEICEDAARQHISFRPQEYATEGWSVRSSGPETDKEGTPYQSFILGHYPDIQLDVRQYESHSSCSAMSLVLTLAHAGSVQSFVEQQWDAILHEEGDLKAAVVEAQNRAWGDEIDVSSYDVFYDGELLFEATQVMAFGSPAIHLDVTPLSHATANPLSDEERQAARAAAASRPVQPPPPINISVNPPQRSSDRTSRISPPGSDVPVVSAVAVPPPSPPPRRTIEEELGTAVTPTRLIDGVRMCMNVVSPQMVLDTQLLIDDRWAYGQPRRSQNEAGMPFETVSYYKDDMTLVLQDLGPVIQCRVGGRIDDLGQIASLRSALVSELGAQDTRSILDLSQWVASVQNRAPQTNFANLFASGDYSLEITTRSLSGPEVGIEAVEQVHMVLVTTVPFPPQFQSREAN